MKHLIVILFCFFVSIKGYSQFQLKLVIEDNKEEFLNIDTFLLKPIDSLNSLIINQLEAPKLPDENEIYNYCPGIVFTKYLITKNKLSEIKQLRGVNRLFDSIIQIQNRIVFDIIKSNLSLDSNNTYSIIIPLYFINEFTNDSIYFKYINNYFSYFVLNRRNATITFDANRLNRYPIPKDIYECIKQIDILIDTSSKNYIKNWDEQYFNRKEQYGLAKWIKVNWLHVKKSDLSKYFKKLGILFDSNMSEIIMTSYQRFLKGQSIQLEELLEYYKNHF